LSACIVGTMPKNVVNPSWGRFLEVLSGIEGVVSTTTIETKKKCRA